MRISLIGAGRVATHLAHELSKNHQIVNVYSRSLEKAQALAEHVDAQPCNRLEEIQAVDLIVIAVSDQAISAVVEQLKPKGSNPLIVHTSGSTHIDVMSTHHQRVGVFYPLQTFSFEREVNWKTTPLFIEANNQKDLGLLNALADSLSDRVYQYNSTQRLSLHLAAVFACNFSNYCYNLSKQIVDAQEVDFSLLHPLILETAQKATHHDPQDVQTGPAIRGDMNILQMHQHMLKLAGQTHHQQVYSLLSDGIMKK